VLGSGQRYDCDVDTHSDLVTIRSFASESEALIAESALDSFGIDCIMSADDCGGLRPHLAMTRGIRLSIRSEDAAEAEDVLANATGELV
jgi:hypothetical protein